MFDNVQRELEKKYEIDVDQYEKLKELEARIEVLESKLKEQKTTK